MGSNPYRPLEDLRAPVLRPVSKTSTRAVEIWVGRKSPSTTTLQINPLKPVICAPAASWGTSLQTPVIKRKTKRNDYSSSYPSAAADRHPRSQHSAA